MTLKELQGAIRIYFEVRSWGASVRTALATAWDSRLWYRHSIDEEDEVPDAR